MFRILLFSWLTAQKRPPTWLTTSWLTTNIQKIAKNAQKSPKFGPFRLLTCMVPHGTSIHRLDVSVPYGTQYKIKILDIS